MSNTEPTGTSDSPLLRVAARLGINRAVGYLLARHFWRFLSGAGTVLIIAHSFTPEVQGYYYTFSSLLGWQALAELGLYIVVMNLASHEWSGLRIGPGGTLAGEDLSRARLASLARFVFIWYAVAALLFILAAGVAGWVFFSSTGGTEIPWSGPWVTTVLLAGLLFWASPFMSLLEGCGQVESVSRVRLAESLLTTLVLWTAMFCGAGLWAVLCATATSLLCTLWLLFVPYRPFFASLHTAPPGAAFHWRTEIWPLQWRLAIPGAFGVLLYSLYTPVLFRYHGAAVAGQMGITWQATSVIGLAAISWVHARASALGVLAARRDFPGLHRLWRDVTLVSTGAVLLGASVLLLLLGGLRVSGFAVADRFLTMPAVALLLAGTLAMHLVQAMAYYLRAHKREPLLASGVVTSLVCGGLVWVLGRRYGAIGACAAYAISTVAVALPITSIIWWRARAAWHQGP